MSDIFRMAEEAEKIRKDLARICKSLAKRTFRVMSESAY